MTTAEALERLNDAEFELLAVRSLRELATDCHAIIHMGMNSQGKTIPGPLDGFCRVPGIDTSQVRDDRSNHDELEKAQG